VDFKIGRAFPGEFRATLSAHALMASCKSAIRLERGNLELLVVTNELLRPVSGAEAAHETGLSFRANFDLRHNDFRLAEIYAAFP